MPLKERKRLLEALCAGVRGTVRYSEHIEGNGDAFFKHAREYGIEGIVSKLADSTYDSTRNRSWLKVKCNKQQEIVIAGYTTTEKGLPGFGALILGVYEKGKLVYAGRVGTGSTFKERGDLKKPFVQLSRPSTPFAVTPKDLGLREAVWVEPKLIAELVFTEWTSDGSIRHPSFQGLREDKKAKRCRPRTAACSSNGSEEAKASADCKDAAMKRGRTSITMQRPSQRLPL